MMGLMIGKISGIVSEKERRWAIIDVSGVGYKIFLTDTDLKSFSIQKEATFWTHLVVREDVLDLYGFSDKETLSLFELLIGISGVGPKSALGILNLAPPEVLIEAIGTQNTSYLTKVSGIGKKSAEKIVLELKDKVGVIDEGTGGTLGHDEDALLALKSLGYTREEARDALKRVPKTVAGAQERIKEALKLLSR